MAVIRALSYDKKIRIIYADINHAVEEISRIHSFNDNNKELFSTVAVSSVLLSADMKDENSIFTGVLRSSVPFGSTVVVCDSQNRIKGYSTALTLDKFDFAVDIRNNAEFDVIIDSGMKMPYTTEIPVCQNSMSEFLCDYMKYSQQHPGIVQMECGKKNVGILIQPVLNSEYSCVKERMDELNDMLLRLVTSASMSDVKNILAQHDFDVTSEYDVIAECDCNVKKMERVIISLGKSEAMDIIDKMGAIEITCPYCLTKYKFDSNAINAIL